MNVPGGRWKGGQQYPRLTCLGPQSALGQLEPLATTYGWGDWVTLTRVNSRPATWQRCEVSSASDASWSSATPLGSGLIRPAM